MIRLPLRAVPALAAFALALGLAAPSPISFSGASFSAAAAKEKANAKKEKASAKKSSKNSRSKKSDSKGAGKATPVGRFGDWDVFTTGGKAKTCYTLAKPKERAPASLKRDDAYVFISNRPAENVQNEVSIIMGFAMKDGSEPNADIGGADFQFVAKGSNAWLKNPAEEGKFVDAMKRGAKLIVKSTSTRGHATTDTYSLVGITDALARVGKECQ
ncbi:MAG: invasion associated locus B family protein [Rhodoblastus sp.]